MTQPMTRPKATGIGIALAILLSLLEAYVTKFGIFGIYWLFASGSRIDAYACLVAVIGVLALPVVVGAVLILARRPAVGRVLLWCAPAQLLLAASKLAFVHNAWANLVIFAVLTALAVVLWLPGVSAKVPATAPQWGYGMPYGAAVPPAAPGHPGQVPPGYSGQVPVGTQYPHPGAGLAQYPQQYSAPAMPPQPMPPQPMPQQPIPGQIPPGQPIGQWPAPGQPQGWPGPPGP
ncbi:hypothetical protein [Amycolatopsis benzoatilytica]|uniref:hypothetical protein n=1 Tax=Amycolatopsis benzoatilytica TaxID=346045 RepID=UPI0003A8A165|nr:hypothetical protein [Amycolatopsis benzoatilytica]